MSILRLKYLHIYPDRHGKRRVYVRRRGRKQIPLPGLPGSREFMDAYQAALEERPISVGLKRSMPGSISALISTWYRESDFPTLKPQTKAVYTLILEKFREEHGEKPVRKLEAQHIRAILQKKRSAPTQANRLLLLIHALMIFAVENDWRRDDPTIGIRKVKYTSKGFHTWTLAEIRQFESFWALGTKERLAFDCLLYTAQRLSDVCRMDVSWISNGIMTVTQEKTGVTVYIPVVKPLVSSIDSLGINSGPLNFTVFGKARTAGGFHNWFSEACRKAGLQLGVSAHGIRKAAATALAERGRTPHEIMSITGHLTLKEVERYTKEASKKRLAKTAMSGMYDDDGDEGEQNCG